MDIGFIGMGAMGSAMARNLLKAGHHVKVWNRSPEAAAALAADGATPVGTPAEAVAGDACVTMLADDRAVRAVFLDGDMLDRAGPSFVHVNCSTISVALVQDLVAAHDARGIGYVAAPVFGRPTAAEARELNIVAAGKAEVVARVQPLLDAMGRKTWAVGADPVRANVIKIAGNLMIASAIESMAEATALGAAHGIAAGDMLDIYSSTFFASPAYKGYGAAIAARRYEPAGFKLRLGLKDVKLALEAGDAANVPLPFGSALRDALLSCIAAGDGDKDWSALADAALRRAGLDPAT